MENVTVMKTELLSQLRENRRRHREVYEAAFKLFKQRAEEELQRRLDDLHHDRRIELVINLPIPELHLTDYDRAIRMVEMSVNMEITLSELDFAMFVMDDWNWKRAWTASTASYVPPR